MPDGDPALPDRDALRAHVCRSLDRYWRVADRPIVELPIVESAPPRSFGALELIAVELPDWAQHCGVDGRIAVPAEACAAGSAATWDCVDWWLAAFLMLECWHERHWERRHGPIHSYSQRLRGWDPAVWSRAWVNRIALFLRVWATRQRGVDAQRLFGPLPEAAVLITHDVDAIDKTLPIRIKQTLFLAFNACRLAARGQWHAASERAAQAIGFAWRRDDWSGALRTLRELERRSGVTSRFHFYAGGRPTGARRWLFDPSYQLDDARVANEIRALSSEGFGIGLHLSFDAWRSAAMAREQRQRLEAVARTPVTACRQHWLRFGWHDTWSAQSQAGLAEDTTLMFNDRPGFRAAAAVLWAPWDERSGAAHGLSVLPTMLMDSQLYDYQPMPPDERRGAIEYWLDELVSVRGEGAVLWHPHTLSVDYGWRQGFEQLIEQIRRRGLCTDS